MREAPQKQDMLCGVNPGNAAYGRAFAAHSSRVKKAPCHPLLRRWQGALALKVDPRVESVDFATVWGQGHTQAERTGSATENFIAWIEGCMA